MDWYYYIAIGAIVGQLLFLAHAYRNYHYVLDKYQKDRSSFRPSAVLIVPCKGLDADFQKNIASFFELDYEDYLLWFVVGEQSDPAYPILQKLKDQLGPDSKAKDVRIFVAGRPLSCSQKVHNLLYCCNKVDADVKILAFADSDICVRSDWLSHLVWPLRKPKHGAASGYRWFVPLKNNLATLALSAINAKIAQLLGNTQFNQAWGGSMAIRAEDFRRLELDKIWQTSLSDDLSLSHAVKKANMKIEFIPACLAASHESTTWSGFFEFCRRQFVITRVSTPRTWLFGLLSASASVFILWGALALAIWAFKIGDRHMPLFMAVPVVLFVSQMIQAILRQTMIAKLLKEELPRLKPAIAADILLFWFWSVLLLLVIVSSAFGNTIRWRGIQYKLLSPTETVIVDS